MVYPLLGYGELSYRHRDVSGVMPIMNHSLHTRSHTHTLTKEMKAI